MEDLEAANARIAELEGQVTSLAGERDSAVVLGEQLRGELGPLRSQAEQALTLQGQVATLEAARDTVSADLVQVQGAALAATRRALLAEHAGQVVPELVTGQTVAEVEASVEVAKAAFGRAADAARAAIAAQTVPAGAGSARTVAVTAGMSPLEMISAGLGAGKGA